jgi:hypothetical protein
VANSVRLDGTSRQELLHRVAPLGHGAGSRPRGRSRLVAGFDHLLVVSRLVRDLLPCAKDLFVAAMVAPEKPALN